MAPSPSETMGPVEGPVGAPIEGPMGALSPATPGKTRRGCRQSPPPSNSCANRVQALLHSTHTYVPCMLVLQGPSSLTGALQTTATTSCPM